MENILILTQSQIGSQYLSGLRRWMVYFFCVLGFIQMHSGYAQNTASSTASYPNRPIRYLVPYPPGGTTDILARLVATHLAVALGQPVVVENRSGAAGNLGTELVAKSAPDGYTILQGTVSQSISVTLYDNLSFSFEKDLDPVALVGIVPNVLVVNPQVPARDLTELIAYIKANPGRVYFGSSGAGSSIHMSGELFKMMTGLDMVHVPYKGSALAMLDLLGGQIQLMFDNLPSSIEHIRGGKLRALAVTTAVRSPTLPAVPTVSEAGLPGYESTAWFGILAPRGTPKEIVNRLNAEVVRIINSPEIAEKMALQGALPTRMTPDEYRQFIRNDVQKWAKVVRAAGVKPD